jgi:transposase
VHAIVDALGNPVHIALCPGQTHEMKLAYELLGDITDAYVAADSAYDAAPLRRLLESNRCVVVIPSNPTRATQHPHDRDLYKERHLVECFFQRIKRFRRISMRFEKLAHNFVAFLHLACMLIWLA